MTFDADKVRDIASAQLADDPKAGAALCVLVDGDEVLSETWGLADADAGTPYTADTLQIVQSMGKGAIAAVAAMLITRGHLDPAERVASYWPEFGTNGKQDITVEQLFSHQTGLVYLDDGMPLKLTTDRPGLAAALVAQSPAWEPGTKVGYSPQTVGNYADFLFEHATGQGLAALLSELTSRLDIEMYVGLPSEHHHRAAQVYMDLDPAVIVQSPEMRDLDEDSLIMRIQRNVPDALQDPVGVTNSDTMRSAFLPAANVFSNARSFARLYSAMGRTLLGDPSPLWSAEVLAESTRELVRGTDACLPAETAFALGFQKPSETYPFAHSSTAFGHGGAGGSFAMADPEANLAVCWIPTSYVPQHFDERESAVIEAIYSALT